MDPVKRPKSRAPSGHCLSCGSSITMPCDDNCTAQLAQADAIGEQIEAILCDAIGVEAYGQLGQVGAVKRVVAERDALLRKAAGT